MPTVEKELNKKGDFLVDYEEKVFPDIKADPGEKALVRSIPLRSKAQSPS